MKPAIAALALLAVGAAGCGGHAHDTALTLRAGNKILGTAVWHVRCSPPRGDIGQAAEICASLRAQPDVLLHPKPFNCWGGPESWWNFTVSGRFRGRPINIRTHTCWTRQMKLLDLLGLGDAQLAEHLVPPPSAFLGRYGSLASIVG